MNTVISTRGYVEAVAAHLDDLPEAERRELLEDLEQHIAEVAAEAEGTLDEILGSPEDYARELRTSAGIGSRDDDAASSFVGRLMRSAPVRLLRSGMQAAPAKAVREFLPELRPAWWVGRGYLGVMVADAFVFRFAREGGYNRDFLFPVPRLGSSFMLGVAAVAAAVWVSVALGRRSADDRGAGVVNLAANIATVAVLFILVTNPMSYARFLPAAPIEYVESYTPEWLQHPDGREISNICAYDSSFRPLGRVLLYDQDGRPIDNTMPLDAFGVPMPLDPDDYLAGELGFEHADADTLPDRSISNAYPREHAWDERTGRVVPFECPTLNEAPAEPAEEIEPTE